MKAREYQEIYDLEETYWWFVGRRSLVRQMVAHFAPAGDLRLLDAGCGTGGTMKRLEGLGLIYGCDLSEEALTYCRQRGFTLLAAGSVVELPFQSASLDVVLSCDVLEHLPDDAAGLAEMVRVLKPGGCLVLTVPAHRFLWSEHDEALAHVRRYSAKELRKRLQEAGLRVTKLSPVVTLTFLPILAFRLLQRLHRHRPGEPQTDLRILPPAINRLLIGALHFENWLLRGVSLPVGTSLVAVARKADG
jgi:SAM-dependent methyltransferase